MTLATFFALLYAAVGWIPGVLFTLRMLRKSREWDKQHSGGQLSMGNRYDVGAWIGAAVTLAMLVAFMFQASAYLWLWWNWALHTTAVPT